MTTDGRRIEVGGIVVELVRKDIKNVHIGIYPPEGRVRLAVPAHVSDEVARMAVVRRMGWIRRRRREFLAQARQPVRELIPGESHYFWGRRYRLRVIEEEARPVVRLRGNQYIEIHVRPGSDVAKRSEVLHAWYREHLALEIRALLEKWEHQVGCSVASWGIRRMRTRWGTCNPKTSRILLNLELVKKPPQCLEYVLVHELVHLIEPRHSDRFRQIMDELLPTWPALRRELNQAPLAHEDWRL